MLSVPLSPSDSGKNIKLNHRDRPRSNLSVNVHSKNSDDEWDANKDSSVISTSSLNTEDQAKLDRFAKRFKDTVGGKEDKEQIQKKIEEDYVDPTPNLVEGIFSVNQTNIFKRCCSKQRSAKPDKIIVYDRRALFFLHFENKVRIELVTLTSSSLFENIIILLIFANTIVLAIYDYNDRDNLTPFNQKLEFIGEIFTIAFAVEMCLKIFAQGMIIHKNAYLRDAWNWLDFIVVVTGIMEMS